MKEFQFEIVGREPKEPSTDRGGLEQRRILLMKQHLDLLQEQLDLPREISAILLQLNDHPNGTTEGDRLRAELEILEERNRTIHLTIQANMKELKECEAALEDQDWSSRKAA